MSIQDPINVAAVEQYYQSRENPESEIGRKYQSAHLVIEWRGQTRVLCLRQLAVWEWLLAKLGFGPAAFTNVINACSHLPIQPLTQKKLVVSVDSYNSICRLFPWKYVSSWQVVPPEFRALQTVIQQLESGDAMLQKKAGFYKEAMQLFQDKGCSFSLQTFQLKKEEERRFRLDHKHSPAYFQTPFSAKPFAFNIVSGFYAYVPSGDGYEDVYVDFANKCLGGGWKHYGFVQEEVMVVEMADFAAHIDAADPIYTRVGKNKATDHRLLQGSPTPYLMKGLHRVLKVNGYKDIEPATTTALDVPQEANVLAIAAAQIYKGDDPLSVAAAQDMFNTVMAGFELVQQKTAPGKKCHIHSGKIGSGVFGNNVYMSYLVQRLAAAHKGIDLTLYAYPKNEQERAEKLWKMLEPKFEGKTLEGCLQIISDAIKSM